MKNLFDNLMELANNDDTPFYYSLQTFGNEYYLIFSYHFTDKDSWLLPDALESRGIMFEVTRDVEYIRLASRPMQKFFNMGEVDFIDYGVPATIMDKADGSLISSWKDARGVLQVKSKGSLYSDHAIAAQAYLNESRNADLKLDIYKLEEEGYTVNLEWTSPDPMFRIVLHYPEARLIVLNARHRETGIYYDRTLLEYRLGDNLVNVNDYIVLNDIDTVIGIEGYVIIDDNGNWYKLKTPWYLERHRAKDFINQPYAFVELVLKEEADDVLGLVLDQPLLHDEMVELQHKIVQKANEFVNNVTKYWETNKDLIRKDFAIKGKAELDGFEFNMAMKFYTYGEEPNWKDMLLQIHKKVDWGIN